MEGEGRAGVGMDAPKWRQMHTNAHKCLQTYMGGDVGFEDGWGGLALRQAQGEASAGSSFDRLSDEEGRPTVVPVIAPLAGRA